MLFTRKTNRMIDNSHRCDLFADGKKIVQGVSDTTAYAYVIKQMRAQERQDGIGSPVPGRDCSGVSQEEDGCG
jgi:hypothetical protein